ncbi:formiminotetrahydrofolate cyclodeaminase [Paraburkholderia sp. GAS33]|jgi:formiminotetrahydrofolate cyclodeaminase|uniref:cyclodeaminase/cyclohydrolase family protein n=1 Tax=Paraburkholderia sp. GAS33 TaxID=3035130 RepID=UPI003D1FD53F
MENLLPPETNLLAQPAGQLLDAFGAGKASPGSGSAAAMMGLLAVKLIRTVCLKSLEKKPDRELEVILRHILEQLADTESALVAIFEKDAREFDEIVRLRIARDAADNADERSTLQRRANDLLETATDNTFQIIDLCLPLINHGVTVFQHGWKAVRGDSGAAISGAIAAVTSGLFIVNLNIKSLKDRNYAKDNIGRCTEQFAELQRKQVTAFSCVTSLNVEALTSLGDGALDPQQLPLAFQDETGAAPADEAAA